MCFVHSWNIGLDAISTTVLSQKIRAGEIKGIFGSIKQAYKLKSQQTKLLKQLKYIVTFRKKNTLWRTLMKLKSINDLRRSISDDGIINIHQQGNKGSTRTPDQKRIVIFHPHASHLSPYLHRTYLLATSNVVASNCIANTTALPSLCISTDNLTLLVFLLSCITRF